MAEIYKYAKRYRPQVSSPPLLKICPCQPRKMNFPLQICLGCWHFDEIAGGWPPRISDTAQLTHCDSPQIMAALEANPTARRTQLQHKFEQVVALMENNIYECYSEA